MDSLLVEAVAETRSLLHDLRGVPHAQDLRLRIELLARAASLISLRPAAKTDVVRLAKLVLDARDEAARLRSRHVLAEAMSQMMD